MLFDPAHKIPGSFVGRCNFSNSVVKKVSLGLSSCRAKRGPVRVFSNHSVSLQCSLALIVPPLLRMSGYSNSLSISSPTVSKEPRNCLRKQVKTSNRVQNREIELRKPFTHLLLIESGKATSSLLSCFKTFLCTWIFSRAIERSTMRGAWSEHGMRVI